MKNTNMNKKLYNKQRKLKRLLNEECPKEPEELPYLEEEEEDYLGSSLLYKEETTDEADEEEELEELEELEEEHPEEKIKKVKNKKKADKAKFYVEPKHFDEEIMKYYDSGVMSNDLAEMISKISNKLSYAPNFINYSYREEMVGDGIIRMMKALISKKYNRSKGTNPFSYFTRIAFNAFRNRIKKEKHIHETHEKYRRELMSMSEGYTNLLKNNNIRIMKERDRLLE